MHLTDCPILTGIGAAALLLGCTPVSDYRIDRQQPADMKGAVKAAPEDKNDKDESDGALPDAAANSDMSSTATGAAGAKGGATKSPKSGNANNSSAKTVDAGAAGGSMAQSMSNASAGGAAAPMTQPSASEASGQAGWAALTNWAALPTYSSSSAQLFSTHERGEGETFTLVDPGNKDFNSFMGLCGEHPELVMQQNDASIACGMGQTGYLIAADDGPGYMSRLLLARGISNPSSSVLVELRPTNERVRIYIDDNPKPVVDSLWSELADAKTAPFDSTLTGWTSGGTASYVPISYSNRLRVFIDDLTSSSLTLYYVHVNTHRVAMTKPYDANVLTSPAARAELDQLLAAPGKAGTSWFDQDVTLEGSGAWTVWTRDQPGTLQRIELELDAGSASEILNETTLRLSWDDGTPAIDLPLAAMYGSRHKLTPVATLPLTVQVDGSSARLSFALPMPFTASAKLDLLHSAPSTRLIKLRLSGSDELPKGEWGRLRSAFSEQRNPQNGERFRVAALSGRGRYLGSIFYVHGKSDNAGQVRASGLGFLEGDERLDVDGQTVWLGTGTDNYFNGGFYFKDGLFSSPFAAVSQLDNNESSGMSEATMMRWNILGDVVDFQKQLDLSFEFGANRPGTARDYAAVSFYYQ